MYIFSLVAKDFSMYLDNFGGAKTKIYFFLLLFKVLDKKKNSKKKWTNFITTSNFIETLMA